MLPFTRVLHSKTNPRLRFQGQSVCHLVAGANDYRAVDPPAFRTISRRATE